MTQAEIERREQLSRLADEVQQDAQDMGITFHINGGNALPARIEMHTIQPLQAISPQALYDFEISLKEKYGPKSHINLEDNTITIPRPDRGPVKLSTILDRLPLRKIPLGTTILGLLDDDGKPVLHNLPSSINPNLFIAGQDASAANLLRTTVKGLEALNHPRHVQIAPFDFGTTSALDSLQDQDGKRFLKHAVINQPIEAEERLSELVSLQQVRAQTQEQDPHIAVAINEPQELFAKSPRAREMFDALLTNGPDSGIHLMVATTKPGLDTSKFNVRLISHTDTARQATDLIGSDHTGAEELDKDAFVSISHLGQHIIYPVHDI